MKEPHEGAARVRVLEAVALARRGDFEGAHEIAQAHEGHALADWLHGVAHRLEGDLGNARYWYRRCGRPWEDTQTVASELDEIERAARPEPG